MRPTLFAASLVLVGAGGYPADAQTRVEIDGRVACGECSITFTRELRIGSGDDPAGFGPMVQVARDSRGRFAVSSVTFVGEIFIYDSSGRFERSIGRRGSGPGEFQRPVNLAFGPGDSLHAIEAGGARHVVFGPSLEQVRTTQLAHPVLEFSVHPTGRILASSPTVGRGERHPFQLLSPEGGSLLAFGGDSSNQAQAQPGRRALATVGPGDRFWTVFSTPYEVRSWSREGLPVSTYVGRREWISSDPLPMRLGPGDRPPGQVAGISVDETGLVWIFAVVADSDWRPLSPGDGPPEPSDMFDTIVEVFDPQPGTLIASTRLDDLVLPLSAGRAFAVIPDAVGENQIHVWRTSVSGLSPRTDASEGPTTERTRAR